MAAKKRCKRQYKEDNEANELKDYSTNINASSIVELILNSLATEVPQHPTSWLKQTALDICLEAVDLLKFQMQKDGHIKFLPSWIKDSEFVRQYEEDYPDEVLKLGDKERIFELPAKLDEHSVVEVMDNIRYFGVDDHIKPITKKIFEFYIEVSNKHCVEPHKKKFPELIVLWENVDFTLFNTLSDEKFMSQAASQNLLITIQYAHDCGHLWDVTTCASAAGGGHLDCLKYAHENGCPWDKETCVCAALMGNLDCLKYAHENGCPWDENTCAGSALSGHLDCLKYAHENGCPWDSQMYAICASAALRGHLDCLKYAHENECPWNEIICSEAASGGHLDCLKYAHENGCPWEEMTCSRAAHGGHLDCLKYAHKNGCPWDEVTTEYGCNTDAQKGLRECFEYAKENGCPEWD